MTKTADDLKGQDYIDSRDIIESAQELRDDESMKSDILTDDETAMLEFDDTCGDDMSEYVDGATMIRKDRFEDYARQHAEDIGAINGSGGWPLSCIDWTRAARELSCNYSLVVFLGYDYYVRL